MIERSRVQAVRVSHVSAVGKRFSSLWSTFCADDSSYGIRSFPCYRSSKLKIPVILPNMQVAGYTAKVTRMHPIAYVPLARSDVMVHDCTDSGVHRRRRGGSSFTWHQQRR